MSRATVACLVIALATSCSAPVSSNRPKAAVGFDADDVMALLKLTVEDLDASWSFRDQGVVPIQVDGYYGDLPERLHGKTVIKVADAEALVRVAPGLTALHLKITFDSFDRVRVLARETWGTGQSWRDIAAARGVDGWTVTQSYGGGYTF